MIPTLAQFAPTPPALPSAPLWERYLLESPGVPIVILVAGAIAAFVVLNRQGKAGHGAIVAAVLGALGAGVAALAYTITTDREAMAAASRELVAAVAQTDAGALDRLLDQDAKLFSELNVSEIRVGSLGLSKDATVRLAAATMRQYPLSAADVVDAQAELTGKDLGRTQVRVRVVPTAFNMGHTSWWLLEWRRSPTGQWRALTIRLVSMDGVGG